MNRTTYFHACAFLLLLALLLLLSEQFSRFSAPHSMLESGKAIDRAVGKATLIDPNVLDLISDPGIKVSANYQQVDSSIEAVLNKVTRKLSRVQSHLKHRVHQAFNVKFISRHRPTANLVTRIHFWLTGELGLPHKKNGQSVKTRLTTRHLAAAGFKAHGQN